MKEDISPFFDEKGKIKIWPSKMKKKKAVVAFLAEKFETGRDYSEKEVNSLIDSWHTFGDYFLLRRSLIEYGFMNREKDGSRYWREQLPTDERSQGT